MSEGKTKEKAVAVIKSGCDEAINEYFQLWLWEREEWRSAMLRRRKEDV